MHGPFKERRGWVPLRGLRPGLLFKKTTCSNLLQDADISEKLHRVGQMGSRLPVIQCEIKTTWAEPAGSGGVTRQWGEKKNRPTDANKVHAATTFSFYFSQENKKHTSKWLLLLHYSSTCESWWTLPHMLNAWKRYKVVLRDHCCSSSPLSLCSTGVWMWILQIPSEASCSCRTHSLSLISTTIGFLLCVSFVTETCCLLKTYKQLVPGKMTHLEISFASKWEGAWQVKMHILTALMIWRRLRVLSV